MNRLQLFGLKRSSPNPFDEGQLVISAKDIRPASPPAPSLELILIGIYPGTQLAILTQLREQRALQK